MSHSKKLNMEINWQDFEHLVSDLLSLSGWNVEHNRNISSQQVDVYAEKRNLGTIERLAIECKAYEKNLSKDEVASIFTKYMSLYDKHLIDRVLLITKKDITSSAKELIENKRGFTHLNISQLQTQVIDFSNYIQSLKNSFVEDGLDQFYTPLKSNEKDLETIIESWLYSSTSKPISILAGYGMGKSTFVRYIAAKQVEKCIIDSQERIPIVIDLGKISDEQSLEGLLGKLMTAEYRVPNFSFDLFLKLNSLGRFIVIFDSFDEMKHGITWASLVPDVS